MKYRTPLKNVKGLGSAKDGSHHWIMQRLTAVGMIVLGLWFLFSIISHAGADRAGIVEWMGNPLAAGMMILFILTGLYHAKLGLQVVVEDYLHCKKQLLTALVLINFGAVFIGIVSIMSVLKLAFGG